MYQKGGRLQIQQLWQRRQSARPCSRLLWQPFGRPPMKTALPVHPRKRLVLATSSAGSPAN